MLDSSSESKDELFLLAAMALTFEFAHKKRQTNEEETWMDKSIIPGWLSQL